MYNNILLLLYSGNFRGQGPMFAEGQSLKFFLRFKFCRCTMTILHCIISILQSYLFMYLIFATKTVKIGPLNISRYEYDIVCFSFSVSHYM